MATKVFLRDSASDIATGSENKKEALLAQGSTKVASDATATAGGPTSGVQVKIASTIATWFSKPLKAVTISGTVTFNLWGLESATQANTGLDVLVERCNPAGAVQSTIVRSERGTELGTSAAVQNWTATPTSTALSAGDRIKITVFGNDAGGNMGSGRTFTLDYGAATGVDGDSYVQFNETLGELSQLSAAGASTPSGTITKDANKPVTGAVSPAGTLRSLVVRIFAGASSPSGSITKTILQRFTGALSPSGALVQRVAKFFSGASSPSGTPIKQVPRNFTGATTPSGSERQSVAILFSGTASPSGALANLKVAVLTVAGVLSPSGALANRIEKFLAGASSPSGSITQTILQRFAGATSPSGALATVKVAVLTVAGALSPSGALANRIEKFLAGASSPSGSTTKTILQRFAGALSPSGMIASVRAILAVAGTTAPAGQLRNRTDKILAGTTTPAGVPRKTITKPIAGATSPSGALRTAVSFALHLAGAIAPGGAFWSLVAKFYGGATTPAGAVQKIVSATFNGAISAIGTLVNLTLGILFKLDITVSDAAVYSCSVAEAAATAATASDAAVTSMTLTDSSL